MDLKPGAGCLPNTRRCPIGIAAHPPVCLFDTRHHCKPDTPPASSWRARQRGSHSTWTTPLIPTVAGEELRPFIPDTSHNDCAILQGVDVGRHCFGVCRRCKGVKPHDTKYLQTMAVRYNKQKNRESVEELGRRGGGGGSGMGESAGEATSMVRWPATEVSHRQNGNDGSIIP